MTASARLNARKQGADVSSINQSIRWSTKCYDQPQRTAVDTGGPPLLRRSQGPHCAGLQSQGEVASVQAVGGAVSRATQRQSVLQGRMTCLVVVSFNSSPEIAFKRLMGMKLNPVASSRRILTDMLPPSVKYVPEILR